MYDYIVFVIFLQMLREFCYLVFFPAFFLLWEFLYLLYFLSLVYGCGWGGWRQL